MEGESIQDSMALIDTFLLPVRAQHAKEAALKEAAEDSSVSFKDTAPANPEEQAKQQPPETSQTNLGQEQTQAAVDSASNVNSVPPNSEEDASQLSDTQGTQTLGTDDKVTDKGNIGSMVITEITQEQKTARAQGLGNAILEVLYKTAGAEGDAAAPGEAGGAPQAAAQAAAPEPTTQPGAVANDADGLTAGNDKTASEEDPVLQKMAGEAAGAAQLYYEGYLQGMIKRAHDEAEVANAGIHPDLLEKAGGVGGLLDKVAMEFPEAVLPEGVDVGAEAAPVEAALPAPEGDAGLPPVPEGDAGLPPAPEEAMAPEGDLGGGEDPADALAAALDEAGVTPEELAQAVEDVSALQEAGIEPEQLAESMTEILGEEGAAAPEEAAAAAPPAVDKVASAQTPVSQKVREILSR